MKDEAWPQTDADVPSSRTKMRRTIDRIATEYGGGLHLRLDGDIVGKAEGTYSTTVKSDRVRP